MDNRPITLDNTRTMKLVMTLLVRDEEDILEANIEYHLAQGVDHIIATDNRSVDRTAAILRAYESKGVLSYRFENGDTHDQQDWVTRMARMASTELQADWIINNDADEFWWPLSGDLKDAFERVDSAVSIVSARRHNFVPTGDPATLFFSRMVYRTRKSLNSMGNPLLPKVAHQANAQVCVAPGNHSVSGFEKPQVAENLIEIFHFPVRSLAQIENKISKGGAALKRNERLPKSVGITWRNLHDELLRDSSLERYYRENFYDAARVAEEIENGNLIPDTRLHDFMNGRVAHRAGRS